MIGKRPLIFWVMLSLALHFAGLVWCPVPHSFRPPQPVYLVVDLFSGPATSGTGHGLDTGTGGGGKPAPSATVPPKGTLQSLPAATKPPDACEPQDFQNPPMPKPVRAAKASKQASVSPEPKATKAPSQQPPVAGASVKPVTGPVLAVTAKPLTGRQDNLGEGPATVASSGTGTGSGTGSSTGGGTGSGAGLGLGPGSGPGRGGRPGSGSPVETPMAYGSNPPPPYPSTARRRGWEGKVLLLVTVSARGEVSKVVVKRSSGYRILDQAALTAVYRWQFQAAQKNGRAVAGQVIVPIHFSIKDAK